MNKKDLSEADICAKFITPAVIRSGWDEQTQIQREVHFSKGQIHVCGKMAARGKSKFADLKGTREAAKSLGWLNESSLSPDVLDPYVKIEVFATRADAQARFTYMQAFRPPFGDGYDVLAGSALLRISADLTPAQARMYQVAFTRALAG